MRKVKILSLILLIVSAIVSPLPLARAQEGEEETIKVDATLVNIPVTVSDTSGRYIPSLRSEDFELYEDNVKQKIEFFSADTVPFNVALIIDVSGSTRSSLGSIKEAAYSFVDKLRRDDRVMVVAFAKNLDIVCGFTSNRNRLYQAIDSIYTGGGTRLYDAVYATVTEEMRRLQGRKAIILLTDGEDTISQLSAEESIDATIESGAIVYALQYPTDDITAFGSNQGGVLNFPFPVPQWPGQRQGRYPRQRRYPQDPYPQDPYPQNNPYPQNPNRQGRNRQGRFPRQQTPYEGEEYLRQLVERTGGSHYIADQFANLSGLANQIANELRHVYVIGYYPTNGLESGGYRRVKVRLYGRNGLKIRHKNGYEANEAKNVRVENN